MAVVTTGWLRASVLAGLGAGTNTVLTPEATTEGSA